MLIVAFSVIMGSRIVHTCAVMFIIVILSIVVLRGAILISYDRCHSLVALLDSGFSQFFNSLPQTRNPKPSGASSCRAPSTPMSSSRPPTRVRRPSSSFCFGGSPASC